MKKDTHKTPQKDSIDYLIEALHKESDYISGEQISKLLGVTRASVWKYIEKLRSMGYEIEAQSHHGYKLIKTPDSLIPTEIKIGLKTRVIGKEILSFASLDSTNKYAVELAEKGAANGTVVIAETQTLGKGRIGRKWSSPEGGIYLSVIIRPDIPLEYAPEATLTTAVSVCETLNSLFDVNAHIKWPNDVLINSKKICGILTELEAEQDAVNFIVMGIGINCNSSASKLPDVATSLKIETGAPVSRLTVLRAFLKNLDTFYHKWLEEGFSEIADYWRIHSATIGEFIRAEYRNEIIEGTAIDIDEHGALLVRLDNGFVKRILSGDVHLLKQ